MIGILIIGAFMAVLAWTYTRAYRQLGAGDFTDSSYAFEDRRLFACTPAELEAAASEVIASLRKTRVVAREPKRILVDVRPSVTNLDDVCGLGVEISVWAAPSDAAGADCSTLHLRAFTKSWGRGQPALLAFSMQSRRALRARGIHEWDPHR